MAYSALQLITRSLFLSQIVSRDAQEPTASQISDGLYLLNALLSFKGTDLRLIPYFTRYEFDSVPNQEEYFIENLYFVDTLTFNIGPVRYSMREQTRDTYFGSARVDNIANLPFSYRVERELGGARIYLYFLPGGVYQMKLTGKFALTNVTLTTDLETLYDDFYIEYLRYALAEYICSEWGATFPEESKQKYKEMVKKITEPSPADLSITKSSYFNQRGGLDWQSINIGKGWWPF